MVRLIIRTIVCLAFGWIVSCGVIAQEQATFDTLFAEATKEDHTKAKGVFSFVILFALRG